MGKWDSTCVFTLSPSTPACVSPAMGARREDCGQLRTDQPLCPQHKRPSSFRGNGQNGFCPSATSCLRLVRQQERDKCLLCVPVKTLLQSKPSSRQLNSSNLYKPKFNISHKIFQLCHKTAQVASSAEVFSSG